ncbi:MAG: DNA methyltransferase [Lachnospiraceae bacterium]|nr:DNA methyltransferase [Lachnospiraceae bacterium]
MSQVDIFFPAKNYDVIYADPPWAYRQQGSKKGKRGMARQHYETMRTEDICRLPVRDICTDQAILFLWATFPNIGEALKVIQAWGFIYKTAAFVWVKRNKRSNSYFWGMGAYTRANAEVCLLAVSKGTKASEIVKRHDIHQIIDAPIEAHSKKPDVVRQRIMELMGTEGLRYIELFARQQAPGWDCWGDELRI